MTTTSELSFDLRRTNLLIDPGIADVLASEQLARIFTPREYYDLLVQSNNGSDVNLDVARLAVDTMEGMSTEGTPVAIFDPSAGSDPYSAFAWTIGRPNREATIVVREDTVVVDTDQKRAAASLLMKVALSDGKLDSESDDKTIELSIATIVRQHEAEIKGLKHDGVAVAVGATAIIRLITDHFTTAPSANPMAIHHRNSQRQRLLQTLSETIVQNPGIL